MVVSSIHVELVVEPAPVGVLVLPDKCEIVTQKLVKAFVSCAASPAFTDKDDVLPLIALQGAACHVGIVGRPADEERSIGKESTHLGGSLVDPRVLGPVLVAIPTSTWGIAIEGHHIRALISQKRGPIARSRPHLQDR